MPKIKEVRPAGPGHQVVTVIKDKDDTKELYRREPCSDCPWRTDAVSKFPAEAFRHSASTAYDLASNKFSCHQSGTEKPATCAGFLLRGADHNMGVRMTRMMNEGIYDDVHDGGCELHSGYREMAIENGVDPEDPILKPCRS